MVDSAQFNSAFVKENHFEVAASVGPDRLRYLSSPETWMRYVEVQRHWMEVGCEIPADDRARIKKMFKRSSIQQNAGSISMEFQDYSIALGIDKRKVFNLSHDQRCALDNLQTTLFDVNASVKSRLANGEIAVHAKPWTAIGHQWAKVDPDVFARGAATINDRLMTTCNPILMRGKSAEQFAVRLSPLDSLSADQALYAFYPNATDAAELYRLFSFGAPDLLGRLPLVDHIGYFTDASINWRRLRTAGAENLLLQLRVGRLSAIDSEGRSISVVNGPGADGEASANLWAPGLFIGVTKPPVAKIVVMTPAVDRMLAELPATAADTMSAAFFSEREASYAQGVAGRPTPIKTMLIRYLLVYVPRDPAAARTSFAGIAREILQWKAKHPDQAIVEAAYDEDTLAAHISKFRAWWHQGNRLDFPEIKDQTEAERIVNGYWEAKLSATKKQAA
jgi:hypothetical protein